MHIINLQHEYERKTLKISVKKINKFVLRGDEYRPVFLSNIPHCQSKSIDGPPTQSINFPFVAYFC